MLHPARPLRPNCVAFPAQPSGRKGGESFLRQIGCYSILFSVAMGVNPVKRISSGTMEWARSRGASGMGVEQRIDSWAPGEPVEEFEKSGEIGMTAPLAPL